MSGDGQVSTPKRRRLHTIARRRARPNTRTPHNSLMELGHMDKKISAEDWRHVLQLMPRVNQRLAQKRRELGAAHVRECWRRGVINGEPDQFFVAEGSLTLGALPSDLSMLDLWRDPATKKAFPGAFMVLIAGDKAHG